MIIVRLSGGLGNQLFQYGLARGLAERTQEEVKIDVSGFHPFLQGKSTRRDFGLDHFAITLKKTTVVENILRKLKTSLFKTMKVVHDVVPFVFNEKAYEQTTSAYFVGNWANYRYVDAVRPILLKEFVLREPMSDAGREILKQQEASTSVSVHIRRGDYLQHQHKFVLLTEDYYKQAIQILRERTGNPRFFVFSDDITYVQQTYGELFGEDAVYVSALHLSDVEELVLMSHCKHNIVANSTFSLWGAWLNQNPNAIVVAPKKYRVDDADDSDFIPAELGWLQI